MDATSRLEAQVYDATSKLCVAALAQWFYDRAPTGMPAVVGRELSQELIHIFGKHRRLCDLLFELLGVRIDGSPVEGVAFYDIQTRAAGHEINRNAGYAGRILENERFLRVEFFVHFLFLLTEPPEGFRTRILGFPNPFLLYVVDLTKFDGLELLKQGIPEAAVLAVLSAVVPRNLLIAGVVQVLLTIQRPEEWSAWTERVFAFAKLRKDYPTFAMELLKEMERVVPNDQRKEELRFIYSAFIDEGYKQGVDEGYKQGVDEGYKQGEEIGRNRERRDLAQKLRKLGVDAAVIAAVTGLTEFNGGDE